MEKYCPDALWHLAQPLLPAHPQRHQGGGRCRTDDRAMLAAIAYVLESGCAWRKLPGSFPVHWRTAHRRFAEWVSAGVMTALHQATLDVLGAAEQIDWSRASIDSMHVRAVKRESDPAQPGRPGQAWAPRPTQSVTATGCRYTWTCPPPTSTTIGGSRTWSTASPDPPAGGPAAQAARKLHGDEGYDYPDCRQALRWRI